MNIAIIGGSFAGISCAMEAKKLYPTATVYVFDRQSTVGFIPSGMNLTLNEEIEDLTEAYFVSEKEIRGAGIKLFLDVEVTAVDPTSKTITARRNDLSDEDDEIFEVDYDKLVLAMGSQQFSPLVKDWQHPQIMTTKELQLAANSLVRLEQAQEIAVIGGGQIGLEATEALVNANKQVTLIEGSSALASRYFDAEFVSPILEAIELVGVDVLLNESVVEMSGTPLKVTTTERELEPDMVILGMNLLPQSGIVADILDLNDDATIIVDDYLETSQTDVFAIGDLVQTPFANQDRNAYVALVNNAVRSGQIAAFNLLEKRIPHQQTLRLIGSRIFSQYMVSVGLTEAEAKQAYLVATTTVVADYSITRPEPVELKIVTEAETGLILGAQLRSEENILPMADTLALAISGRLTDNDLAFQDRLYYPGITPTQPVINLAALRSLENRLITKA